MGERWRGMLCGSVGMIGLLAATPVLAGDRATPTGPLVPPPLCSGINTALPLGAPECARVANEPGSLKLTLNAQVSAVANVAGYARGGALAGGYTVETTNYNGTYHPPIMEVEAGHTIYFDLFNKMPGATAPTNHNNLHTHGLIVAPRPLGSPEGLGDNIFVDLAPGATPPESAQYRINIPKAIPKAVFDPSSLENVAYPSGLNWYHPHIHEVTSPQVGGGMAGLISIGAPKDQLVVAGPGGLPDPAATAALRRATDVEYLIMQDMQITSATPPENADGTTATIAASPANSLCGPPSATQAVSKGGYCTKTDDPTKIWLFTINGQRYPDLKVPPLRNKLWRIANMSANVTYILQLVDEQGNLQNFDVVTVDGVTAGKPKTGSKQEEALSLTSLMMMPASRAEILVRNDGSRRYSSGNLVLRTKPVNGFGTIAPAVELAAVTIEPLPVTAQASTATLSIQPPPVLASVAATPVTSAAARSKVAAGHGHSAGSASGHAHTQGAMTTMADGTAPAMGGASVLGAPAGVTTATIGPCFQRPKAGYGLLPGERRKVSFDLVNNNKDLGLGSYIIDRRGKVTTIQAPAVFNAANTHVCSPFGASEVWELENTTTFSHNFHMHQVKFRLANAAELKALGITGGPIDDPTGAMAGLYLPGDGGTVDAWHDTLPLPPAKDAANPGRAYVVINFKATEQIGSFVFHCHILGHEDDGMMQVMEVVREPARVAAK